MYLFSFSILLFHDTVHYLYIIWLHFEKTVLSLCTKTVTCTLNSQHKRQKASKRTPKQEKKDKLRERRKKKTDRHSYHRNFPYYALVITHHKSFFNVPFKKCLNLYPPTWQGSIQKHCFCSLENTNRAIDFTYQGQRCVYWQWHWDHVAIQINLTMWRFLFHGLTAASHCGLLLYVNSAWIH